ncbi:MAG: general secretion pathway protein GspA [Deltaproteobacteria bacterium]|nr:MAG: general secretion pathway protein GspA [Deltaproteobacteria bacterium]RLC24774.1 MAG: general secretion pathway protein GspA [Deltaproteobacteria bacterium]
MYKEFYGFKEKPFNLVPNPSYLFLSTKHANALSFLEYGLTEKVGFVMLTGEIGIGKTTIVRYLLNQIESDMDVAVIFNTNVLSDDLINLILSEFEIEYDDTITKAKALTLLYEFLIEKYSKGRKVLLIIDEAQNLSENVLEEIRMLSNLQTDEEMLLQIMIVGQPELRDKINDPRLEQFAQRIAVSYHLSAMTLEETEEYIDYRLEKAGGKPDLFFSDAVKKIYEISTGIPRTINLLCDASLVYGYADEKQKIDSGTVDQVVQDKGGMGVFTKNRLKPQDLEQIDPSSALHKTSPGNLIKRLIRVENNFSQLKALYHTYSKEIESRAQFCREEMLSELKTSLSRERKNNEKLALEHGRLQERYRLLLRKFRR